MAWCFRCCLPSSEASSLPPRGNSIAREAKKIPSLHQNSVTPSNSSPLLPHVPLHAIAPSSSPKQADKGGLIKKNSLRRGGDHGKLADQQEISQPPPAFAEGLNDSLSRATSAKVTSVQKMGLLHENTPFINEYVILRVIGKGSFGEVSFCVNVQNGREYAIKICKRSLARPTAMSVKPSPPLQPQSHDEVAQKKARKKEASNDVRREVAIMKKLRHPNITRLYEVIDDPESNRTFLVMEYLQRGAVMTIDKTGEAKGGAFDETKARKYFIDLLDGLQYLHTQCIIHRDIKVENLLLDQNDRIKITDFGMSLQLGKENDDLVGSEAGTPAYFCPELFRHTKWSGRAADIWSCGIVLYAFVCGRLPFFASSIQAVSELILNTEPSFRGSHSPLLIDLLQRLLEKDPARRISLDNARSHPWLTGRPSDVALLKRPPIIVTRRSLAPIAHHHSRDLLPSQPESKLDRSSLSLPSSLPPLPSMLPPSLHEARHNVLYSLDSNNDQPPPSPDQIRHIIDPKDESAISFHLTEQEIRDSIKYAPDNLRMTDSVVLHSLGLRMKESTFSGNFGGYRTTVLSRGESSILGLSGIMGSMAESAISSRSPNATGHSALSSMNATHGDESFPGFEALLNSEGIRDLADEEYEDQEYLDEYQPAPNFEIHNDQVPSQIGVLVSADATLTYVTRPNSNPSLPPLQPIPKSRNSLRRPSLA